MAEPPEPRKTDAEQRRARQAAALRENLRRRKEQARAAKEAQSPPRETPKPE